MRTILFLLEKEFRQIFRNKTLLPLIFAVPVVQLLILPLAADYQVKNIKLAIVNKDNSVLARELITKVTASGYFQLAALEHNYADALEYIESDRADVVLEIPRDFEKTLIVENHATLFMAVNAINGVKAGLGASYLGAIIQDFNQQVNLSAIMKSATGQRSGIEVIPVNWYNPLMRYDLFMVPGI
ncbi:MAG: ABC transporter permease, partial [Bacteroidota bacterium]|nr:ABC transporter permease [Bacteroidota bacterium]